MAEERVQRRLAAILAADVVGYSRLIRADEAGTRARFNAHFNDMIDPRVSEHRGRIVKTTGDGLLVEFASVVDAVQCAVEIQRGMADRNVDVEDDQRLDFRIGVNLGDVIIEGDDIHGDGVNVASRLEGLADPAGICVSAKVFEEIRYKLGVGFEDLGEQEVKNIPQPVRAYRLVTDPDADGQLAAGTFGKARRWKWAAIAASVVAVLVIAGVAVWNFYLREPVSVATADAKRLSIVVLPFNNLSGDPKQNYFADGITQDLITDLSRIRGAYACPETLH